MAPPAVAKTAPVPSLVPGPAFHLEGDGNWDVQEVPEVVLQSAAYVGDLKIEGYPCVVFETPDGDQWAQKAPGTPAPKGDEAAEQVVASVNLYALAARMAKVNLEDAHVRAARGLAPELKEAVKSLDKAVQHSRGLRTNASLEWIADLLDQQLDSLKEAESSVLGALDYVGLEEENEA